MESPRKIYLLIVLLLICTAAQAQLFVTNNGDKQIQLAIGFMSPLKLNGWQTKGWFIIAPKETASLINQPLSNRYYYIYGSVIGCDGEYSGTNDLIVDPVNAFTISQADQSVTLQSNAKFTTKKFIQLDLIGKTSDTVKLAQAKCTLNGKREGEWIIYYDRDWEETQILEDASYYRKIRYQEGVPLGFVRDYYMSGKLQWEGKLKSESPEILHGTCIWYYENGNKSKECIFNNGELVQDFKEWEEDGTPITYHKSYEVVSVLAPQRYFINNPLRVGGKSRIVIPINLPKNTVSWYYTFAASRDPQEIEETKNSLSLLGDLTTLVDQTKMTSIAINLLASPTGANVCDVYWLDSENQSKFSNSEAFKYRINGSRENYASGTVPIEKFQGLTHYLGVENPTTMHGIHFTIEVVAVVVQLEKK